MGKPSKETGPEPVVIATGGEVDGLVMALIETVHDKDEETRVTLRESLQEIGKKQSALVLSSCEVYLTKHKKLVLGHRVALLTAMTEVTNQTIDELGAELALRLVRLGVTEMTFKLEIVPEWQEAASQLIVAIGAKFGRIVLDELTARFIPGHIPHYFVIKTIGEFCSSNVFVTVPALEEIIGRSLPMLGMVKHDNMRWVFAQTFARYSDAILSYIANLDRADDKSITIGKFSQQMYSAFEVMFNVWLNSREPKLRLAVVEALGLMSQILSKEKLAMTLPRLIPGMLGLYKKFTSDTLPVTMGLERVLGAATKDGDELLAPHFDTLVNTMYPLLQFVPNYSDPPAVKNYNELLRCFERLCEVFSDQLMAFLFLKLENKDERSRTGALNVLKHLVNSADASLADKRALVVTGLRPLLEDTSTMVQQALAQLIIALAHHDYLRLEGGEVLVQFIVRLCAYVEGPRKPETPSKKKGQEVEQVTPLQLRRMCDSILHLCTTTIPAMELVLYPYLLEFILPVEYTEALSTVCMNLSTLGNKFIEAESDSYDIDYEVMVNLPNPHQTIARLLVVAGHPLYRDRGVHILNLLQVLAANLHEEIDDTWSEVIPKLIAYLEKNSSDGEEWKQQAWEDLLLSLLSRTLDDVEDEEWILHLGQCFGQHFDLYPGQADFKNMCSKCLGVVLRKSTNKAFIDDHLGLLFANVDHTSQVEREGCARAFGFAASSHLDQVVEKLGTIAKTDMVRRSSGFMGLVKDKSEADVSRIKATLMLCYGYVTLYAPPALITSRVEVNILASINPHFNNVKDPMVKENLIRCVDLIGKSLHPTHLKVDTFTFHRRGDLLGHMQNYMRGETMAAIKTETRALAIDACTTLITLAPKLSDADLFQLVDVATNCVFELPDIPKEDVEATKLFGKAMKSLNSLLSEAISKDTTASCLQSLFKHLAKWLNCEEAYKRERMISSYLGVLGAYQEALTVLVKESTISKYTLDGLGKFLADLVPRCTDPSLAVRQDALGAVQVLLRIQEIYQGNFEPDVMVEAISKLQERTEKQDSKEQFAVVNDLAKVFAKKVAKEELLQFLYPLLEGLLDKEADSASGACVVVNGIFRLRGEELGEEIETLIEALHEKMTMVHHERTGTGILRAMRTLGAHHLELVLKKLLSFEVPYDTYVVDTWHTLCTDMSLAPRILAELLDILNTSRPYEEKDMRKGVSQKLPALPPMKATCALRELCSVDETEGLVQEHYAAIFAATLTRVVSCAGIELQKAGPSPVLDAIDAFKEFLTRSQSQYLFDALDEADAWAKFENEYGCTEACTVAARAICQHAPEHVAGLIDLFEPVLKRVYGPQRVVAAACFAEFIQQSCGGELSHINRLKNGLLSKLVDPYHLVRMLCIRGLGNISAIPDEQIKKHATTVLSAMMSGMDDRDDPNDDITLEAMKGLSKILPKLEEDNMRAILINISLRIRPCFEKDKQEVRAAAILLFGNLSRFGDGPSREPFLEQIHSNLVSLLVHLNDPEEIVRDASKTALKRLGAMLEFEPLDTMFAAHLQEGRGMHYGEFINDLTKILLQGFPDKVNFYTMNSVNFFKSEWKEVRANAAMFAGFLLGNLELGKRKVITKEHVCGEMIRLLKDSAPVVRKSAGEAMSQLYDY